MIIQTEFHLGFTVRSLILCMLTQHVSLMLWVLRAALMQLVILKNDLLALMCQTVSCEKGLLLQNEDWQVVKVM